MMSHKIQAWWAAWWRPVVWCVWLGWLLPAYGAGGIGGTGITAFGGIQGFGSIFVNGREYHLQGTRVLVDGVNAQVTALRQGQVVLVSAQTRAGRLQSVAVHVRHALQGPVTAVSAHAVQVMGHTIRMPPGFQIQGPGAPAPWTTLRAGDVIRVSALAESGHELDPLRVTRLYRAGHVPRAYPVMLRATLQRVHPRSIQLDGVRFRVARPVASGLTGSAVLARGVMRAGVITMNDVRPDGLRLGTPGTIVEMSGYVTHTGRAWQANGVPVRFRGAIPPVRRMLFIRGVVDAHDGLLAESYRVTVPRPPQLGVGRPESGRPRTERPSAGHIEVDRPEVERPFTEGPDLSRPEVERPETGR